jgi:ABC-type transporter Mla MlaB component
MSARRPRKPYTSASVTALDRLMSRIRPEPARPMAAFYTALDMIARHQHPGEAEWRDLADVVNHIETLMMAGHLLREEAAPLVAAGTAGMAAAARRWRDGQGVRLDAAGLTAMRELLAVYEACTAELPADVMEAARRTTADRVRAHRQGRPAGVEVIEV